MSDQRGSELCDYCDMGMECCGNVTDHGECRSHCVIPIPICTGRCRLAPEGRDEDVT